MDIEGRGAGRLRGIDPALVLGAGLHWASMVFGLLAAPGNAGGEGWGRVLLVTALAVLAACAPDPFAREGTRRGCAAAGIAASVGSVVLASPLGATPAGALLWCACSGVGGVAAVLLWGLAFASLDKRVAGMNAALTALAAVALTCAAMLAVRLSPLAGASAATEPLMRAASLAVLLGSHVRVHCERRVRDRSATPALARLVAARVALGACVGIVSHTGPAAEALAPLVAGSLVAALLLAPLMLRAGDGLYGLLPLVPLLLFGLVLAPYLTRGEAGLVAAAPGIIWLCWIFVSSFQLSGLKEVFGLGEGRLCFLEKAAIMLGRSAGLPLGELAASAVGVELTARVALYLAVLWATFASFRTVYNRKEDERIEASVRMRAERATQVYDRVAAAHGLTPREREVMEMLAQGYTRAYVRDALGISDGTTSAHIAHVYQKLGVHKKDELLELVRRAAG